MKTIFSTKTLLLSISILFLFGSCSKGGGGNSITPTPTPTPTPQITIPPASQAIFTSGLSVVETGSTSSVSFTATDSWTVDATSAFALTKVVSWISISPLSGGAGSATITITVQKNETPQTRTATITIRCGSVTKSFSVKQDPHIVNVESITLNKTTLDLIKGTSETLTATITPDNATTKTVEWSSSATTVATVDNSGKVTAVGGGSATITAKCGGKSATCSVTVTVPVESVSLNKTELTINKGESETLTATINPSDATDKTLEWQSSNTAAATVDNTGKVTAVYAGNTTITVSASGKTATCLVTVVIPVESVTLNKPSLTLTEGTSETLTAEINPSDATDKKVTWTSSNTAVATVDSNGKVEAKAIGTATITATCGGKSATCSVTVAKKGSISDRPNIDI